VRFVSAHKINFGTEKMSYTNTNHKFVFVYRITNTKRVLGLLHYLNKLQFKEYYR
jgi:hypothetical protein